MFAVIEDGSRQYRIQRGDRLTVDYRADVQPGDSITFDRVLLANGGASSAIGKPTIEGASVQAEIIVPLEKGKKLEIQKFRRRKNSRRHTGHRQKYTTVRITDINVPGLEIIETEPVEQPADQAQPLAEPKSAETAEPAGAEANPEAETKQTSN
jgi:large subunit ribosomal protein L21